MNNKDGEIVNKISKKFFGYRQYQKELLISGDEIIVFPRWFLVEGNQYIVIDNLLFNRIRLQTDEYE